MANPTVIGSVFERKPINGSSTKASGSTSRFSSTKTGFPVAQHRSQHGLGAGKSSAFMRGREERLAREAKEGKGRDAGVPTVLPSREGKAITTTNSTSAIPGPGPQTIQNLHLSQGFDQPSSNDWRQQISSENTARVAQMTPEELEAERREILERFGEGVSGILKKARERREREAKEKEKESIGLKRKDRDEEQRDGDEVPVTSERVPSPPPYTSHSPHHSPPRVPPTPILSSSLAGSRANTRPNSPTRASTPRKLRFAELTADQVHVYPSAPSSPRKKTLLALPAPEEGTDDDTVSLGTFCGRLGEYEHPKSEEPTEKEAEIMVDSEKAGTVEELEEGTPEYIRAKFFPSAAPNNPDLAWITSSETSPSSSLLPTSEHPSSLSFLTTLRFSLTGHPIAPSVSSALPSHLGLHHHAQGTSAGYTLEDIFLLSRSSVRAQRGAMLGVLRGIVGWLRGESRDRDRRDSDRVGVEHGEVKGEVEESQTKAKAKAKEEEEWEQIEEARLALISSASSLEGAGSTSTSTSSTTGPPPLMKRILFTALEALPERGVVGVRAMEVLWACVSGVDVRVGSQASVEGGSPWEDQRATEDQDQDRAEAEFDFGGIEYRYPNSSSRNEVTDTSTKTNTHDRHMAMDMLSSLPLSDVLPQFVNILRNPPDSASDASDASASVTSPGPGSASTISTSTSSTRSILAERANFQVEGGGPTPTQQRTMSILIRLARSAPFSSSRDGTIPAETIVRTTGLVRALLDVFVIPFVSSPGSSSSSSSSSTHSLKSKPRSKATEVAIEAITLLTLLASASRTNAYVLSEEIGVGDVLLRFVVLYGSGARLREKKEKERGDGDEDVDEPSDSDSDSEGDVVLTHIIRFYTTLGRYGLYTRVAGDAREAWVGVGRRIAALARAVSTFAFTSVAIDDPARPAALARPVYDDDGIRAASRYLRYQDVHRHQLIRAYAALIETYLTCALDPHATTPEHGIRWSQVRGWEWGGEVVGLIGLLSLKSEGEDDSVRGGRGEGLHNVLDAQLVLTRASLHRALAAYFEGAKINGVRGGEGERAEVIEGLLEAKDTDLRRDLRVAEAIEVLRSKLERLNSGTGAGQGRREMREISRVAFGLYSVMRLWLACLPPIAIPAPSSSKVESQAFSAALSATPFNPPFDQIEALCSQLYSTLLSHMHQSSSSRRALLTRPLTMLLIFCLRVYHVAPLFDLRPSTRSNSAESVSEKQKEHEGRYLSLAFNVLRVLQRGDEAYAQSLIAEALSLIDTKRDENTRARKGTKEILGPFFAYEVNPHFIDDGSAETDEALGEMADMTGMGAGSIPGKREYIAPICATPESIKWCTTLRLPAPVPAPASSASSSSAAVSSSATSTLSVPNTNPNSNLPTQREWHPTGLPLSSGWTLSPITHLLRSGSENSIFQQRGLLPNTWDASETEVVRAALRLSVVERSVYKKSRLSSAGQNDGREEIILGCMQVFMLEHGVNTGKFKSGSLADDEISISGSREGEGEGAGEVFRDTEVARLMRELLDAYTLKVLPLSSSIRLSSLASQNNGHDLAPLELAALPFLPTIPFYQFYTDFLSLYDAISFSHPLFARLLLPPTSMRYVVDYRKLLWRDYAHVLRGVRVDIGDAICGSAEEDGSLTGIGEWLYPLESDPEVLGAYLSALIRYGPALQGYLRFVAIHHVATGIWPDLRGAIDHSETGAEVERAKKMLRAVVSQGGKEVVWEVLRYRQPSPIEAWLPPRCFNEIDDAWKRERCTLMEKWGGVGLIERIRGVFD